MDEQCPLPSGKLILRTLAMPSDTNVNGDIFGGWIMSQMDIAGGIYAQEIGKSRVVTVAVEAMKFLKPVKIGDIVSCYGAVIKTGLTSLTLHIEVWVESVLRETEGICPSFKVTEGVFTYVAIDESGKKQPVQR